MLLLLLREEELPVVEPLTGCHPDNTLEMVSLMIGHLNLPCILLGSRDNGHPPNLMLNHCPQERSDLRSVSDSPQIKPKLGALPVLNLAISPLIARTNNLNLNKWKLSVFYFLLCFI